MDFRLQQCAAVATARVARPLGDGRVGETYLAEDLQDHAPCVIKLVSDSLAADSNFSFAFLRQARILERLRHPRIAAVRASGYHEGRPFLIMDYIAGPAGEPLTLRGYLEGRLAAGKPATEDEVTAVALELCEAVSAVHEYRDDDECPYGLVCGDLRPNNVLLGDDTGLYLTDIGFSALPGLPPRNPDDPSSAAEIDYVSPEVRGGQLADARSDIYSLGAILYELLTGRKVAGVPSPPSTLRKDIHPGWDQLLMDRCLCYNPEQRFASALALGTSIRGLETQPRMAPAPVAPPSPAKKRSAVRLWALSLAATGAMAGAILFYGPERATPVSPRTSPAAVPPLVGRDWSVPGLDLTMRWIPAGRALVGSTESEQEWATGREGGAARGRTADLPQARVDIASGFWLGQMELTRRQWRTFRPGASAEGQEAMPVTGVTLQDARDFCVWLNEREKKAGRLPDGFLYRLPCEIEWEYACRGGADRRSRFWWGNDIDEVNHRAVATAGGRRPDGPAAAGSLGEPGMNRLGLSDMLGNVAECCDGTETPGPARLASWRGGAYADTPGDIRCASRREEPSDKAFAWGGLRVMLGRPTVRYAPRKD